MDLKITTILPLQNDTIISPSTYKAQFSITNVGEDTFWTGEKVKVSPEFGGIYYGLFTYSIRKPLYKGQFDSFSLNLYADGLFALPTYFCFEMEGILYDTANRGTVNLMYEADSNNKNCVDLYHALTSTKFLKGKETSFKAYPNPAANNTSISILGFSEVGDYKIRIYDVLGKECLIQKGTVTDLKKEESIYLKKLNPGVYTILIEQEGETSVTKLVIQ